MNKEIIIKARIQFQSYGLVTVNIEVDADDGLLTNIIKFSFQENSCSKCFNYIYNCNLNSISSYEFKSSNIGKPTVSNGTDAICHIFGTIKLSSDVEKYDLNDIRSLVLIQLFKAVDEDIQKPNIIQAYKVSGSDFVERAQKMIDILFSCLSSLQLKLLKETTL